jgi:hypothetical protein
MTARDHVTRVVMDANHVARARDHVVQADDGSWIRPTYRELLDNFSKKNAETRPPHRSTDHAIDLKPGT